MQNPITKARERLNITQAELARRSGIPYQRIWALENGRRDPKLLTTETALRLVEALEIVDAKNLKALERLFGV